MYPINKRVIFKELAWNKQQQENRLIGKFGVLMTFGTTNSQGTERSCGIVKGEDGQLHIVELFNIKIVED